LVARHEIHNGQPTMPEPDPWREMEAIAVWSPMTECISHASKQGSIDLPSPTIVENTSYTAHPWLPGRSSTTMMKSRLPLHMILLKISDIYPLQPRFASMASSSRFGTSSVSGDVATMSNVPSTASGAD
jgi:hypothetical protein